MKFDLNGTPTDEELEEWAAGPGCARCGSNSCLGDIAPPCEDGVVRLIDDRPEGDP